MKNKKLEANLSMAISKVFSGLNMNALKFLLPLWMSPLTGATIRCTFAAVALVAVMLSLVETGAAASVAAVPPLAVAVAIVLPSVS